MNMILCWHSTDDEGKGYASKQITKARSFQVVFGYLFNVAHYY